jgi:hypothetical protein
VSSPPRTKPEKSAPKVDVDSQSDHDQSGDESDDREALQVAIESELVWAETEAWVEAELIAEEEAWSHLLLPLSSDLDTDAEEADCKTRVHEIDAITPSEDSSPEKGGISLITCEHSDDQDSTPPAISIVPLLESPLLPFLSPGSVSPTTRGLNATPLKTSAQRYQTSSSFPSLLSRPTHSGDCTTSSPLRTETCCGISSPQSSSK